jgi:hypothetical protein
MAVQIVMDRTGDTRHEFDHADAAALARAEARFKELTGAGFTAAARAPSQARLLCRLPKKSCRSPLAPSVHSTTPVKHSRGPQGRLISWGPSGPLKGANRL